MDERVFSSERIRGVTSRQQAAYEACPYHFRITYRHAYSTGEGSGQINFGVQGPELTAADRNDVIEKIRQITAANVQADGVPFDPSSFTVEFVSIEPLG